MCGCDRPEADKHVLVHRRVYVRAAPRPSKSGGK
jgi:hypothetical protein